jgi:peptidoglycan/xylan/chitin deacetylase (PgdA/CDA1 family)
LGAAAVPGTFFVVGRRIDRVTTPLLERAVTEGHRVQNHTMNHLHLRLQRPEVVTAELANCQTRVQRATGVSPTAFRPPYGSVSAAIVARAAALGMETVMWNACPVHMIESTAKIKADISWQAAGVAHRHQGLNLLLHDGSGSRQAMVAALAWIIGHLRAEGWEFVVLS